MHLAPFFKVPGVFKGQTPRLQSGQRQLVAGLYLFSPSFFKSSADALSLLNDESYQGEEGNL
jgi:hypothetical protein